VELVRSGWSRRRVAWKMALPLSTVQHWLRRAGEGRLDRVGFEDRITGSPNPSNSTAEPTVRRVVALRARLALHCPLGECGKHAIYRALAGGRRPPRPMPSVSTIGRILARRGLAQSYRRRRFPPPPPGWYLPEVAAGGAELDGFDVVEEIGPEGLQILSGISLRGALADIWPTTLVTAVFTSPRLLERWRQHGAPAFAQFDNDMRFHGPHHHPDSLGAVTRFCLRWGVVPVFTVPREHAPQNFVESFNERLQRPVRRHGSAIRLSDLRRICRRYVEAHRRKTAARRDAAPPRHPLAEWEPDWVPRVIFLRRCDPKGRVKLLGRRFSVEPGWAGRVVRCELFPLHGRIEVHGLRRSHPQHQPHLTTFKLAKGTNPFADIFPKRTRKSTVRSGLHDDTPRPSK
jgi:hypothetical protein